MRDRFITWGTREGQRRLFTFELEADDAQIIRRTLPPEGSSEEMLQTIMNAWIQVTTIEYPAGTNTERIPFAATGSIVPEGAEVEDKVRVASAEREWPFDVVSALMRRQFQGELEELRDVINGLEKFDEAIFERAKAAWNKVQGEVSNQALRYEHSLPLREISDEMFATLKKLRRGESRRRQDASKGIKRELQAELAAAQTKLESKPDLRVFFNELRDLQQKVNQANLAHPDRNALRKRLDELFKATKSEMNATGADVKELSKHRQHLENRLKGLEGAIARMRYSVDRDNKDMYYESRRADQAGNQLAEQLAKAKLIMIGDQAKSKASRLDDMLATEAQLRKKLEKLIASEARLEAKRKAAAAPSDAALVASSDGTAKPPRGAKPAQRKAGSGATSDNASGARRQGPRTVTRKMLRDASAVLSYVGGARPTATPPATEAGASDSVVAPSPAAPEPKSSPEAHEQRDPTSAEAPASHSTASSEAIGADAHTDATPAAATAPSEASNGSSAAPVAEQVERQQPNDPNRDGSLIDGGSSRSQVASPDPDAEAPADSPRPSEPSAPAPDDAVVGAVPAAGDPGRRDTSPAVDDAEGASPQGGTDEDAAAAR